MRECVSLHIGQTGGGLGRAIWKLLCHEHGIGPDGVLIPHPQQTARAPPNEERPAQSGDSADLLHDPIVEEVNIEPFFREALGYYTPRCVFVDQDPTSALAFEAHSPWNSLFNPSGIVVGREAPSRSLYPVALDNFRKSWEAAPANGIRAQLQRELEKCDNPSAFHLTYSSAGATGGAVANFLQEAIRDLSTSVTITNTVQLPGGFNPRNSLATSSPTAIINCALSLSEQRSDLSLSFDNEALMDIAFNLLEVRDEPTFPMLNDTVAALFGSLTTPTRYPYAKRPGGLRSRPNAATYSTFDLPAIANHLAPLPEVPFIVGGFAPITAQRMNLSLELEVPSFGLRCKEDVGLAASKERSAPNRRVRREPTVREIIWAMFSPENMMLNVDPYCGRYVKAMVIFRGPELTREEIVRQTIAVENHGVRSMVAKWLGALPRRMQAESYVIPEKQLLMSAGFFGALTSISARFADLKDSMGVLIRKKAYLHWYEAAGLELDQLRNAYYRLHDMVEEYEGLQQIMAMRQDTYGSVQKEDFSDDPLRQLEEELFRRTNIKMIWT